MTKIISIHSFRGGTGKSNTTANLAAILAQRGQRVGVIDTDIQSPGIHVLFGMAGEEIPHSLNDYLWGHCTIAEVAHDVTARLNNTAADSGAIYLMPASIKAGEIGRVLREGYNVNLLVQGIQEVTKSLNLDYLLIDTHPGLNEETLLSIAITNTLIVVMRPDEQDYEGTGVTIRVARRLEVDQLFVVVNKTPAAFNHAQVKAQVEQTYACQVAAVLPHADEMMTLASAGIFSVKYPGHLLTTLYNQVVDLIYSA